jgi:hypothetical protein
VLVAGTAVFGAPEGVRTGIAAIRAAARRGQRLVLEGGQKKAPSRRELLQGGTFSSRKGG